MRHSYFIQQLLPAIVMMFAGVTAANAYDFEVDGIYYYIASNTEITVNVTYSSEDYNSYSGDVTIPSTVTYNGTTYSVAGIGDNAFNNCTSLTSVNIPSSVTIINSYAFYNCDSLTSITIPDNVTIIGQYAFYDCDLLQSITIPDKVQGIQQNTFESCDSLTTVIIGESLITIGQYAFNGCKELDSISLPNSLKNIGDHAFQSCTSLPSITFPESVDSIGESAFYGCSSLRSVTIPDSVKNIYSTTFSHCLAMDSVNLGNGVKKIFGDAFNYCTSLPSITFPESVDSIGQSAFYGCSSLRSLIIPDGITGMGSSAFSYCSSLTNVELGSGISYIHTSTFSYCTSLPSVIIPDGVKSIGESAFQNCTSLTSVKIGNSVTTIGESAFNSCTSLTSITIPDNVTSIGDYAFYYCTSSTSVKIGNGVTTIGGNAFDNCSSLTSITIPDNVTSIGANAFRDCSSLTSIILGSGITYIGSYGFRYCNALKSIYCMGNTAPELGNASSLNISTIKNSAVVFVDGKAFNSYRTTTQWKRFTRVAVTRYMDEGEEINAGDTLNIYTTTNNNDTTYAVVTFGSKNASDVWAAAEEEKTLDVVGPFSNYVKGKVAATNEDGGSYDPTSEDNNTFDAPIAGAYLMMEPKADGTIYVAVKKQGDVYVCDETGTAVDYLMAELPNGEFELYGSSSEETDTVETSESESASDTEETTTDTCIRYSFPALAGKTYFVTSTNENCLSVAGYAFEPESLDDPFAANTLTISDSSEDNLTESSTITTGQYDVTLNRSFTKGGWTSMVLPFSVSPSMLNETFGDSTAIIYFNRVSSDTLYLTEHYHDMIVAGTPMFIRPDTTATSLTFKCVTYGEPTLSYGSDYGTWSVDSQELPSIDDNIIGCENNKSDWELKASYVSVQGEENDSTHYYMIGFKYETDTIMVADENGDSIKVAKVDSTVINNYFFEYNKVMNIKGLRAWLEDVTEDNSAARLITVSRNGIIDDDDTETTGIINALTGNSGTATAAATRRSNSGNGNIYNLHGQMVRHASEGTSGLPQGIYIVNGKKIIVE